MSPPLFLRTYSECRAQFLKDAVESDGKVECIEHEQLGPAGETLTTDVAVLQSGQGERVLIVCSGTHGIEGFCGSAIQSALLRRHSGLGIPENVTLVLVHALNPYGFAWLRRTNEDNVDLNRNFRDFSMPPPANALYDEIHADLVPADWDGPLREAADQRLTAYVKERGARALQAALSGGQYDHPDGLFYGGLRASWSNRTWRSILRRYGVNAKFVAAVDVHSGLGESGACELISGARRSTIEHELATRWFGNEIRLPGADSTAPSASGFMGSTLTTDLSRARGAMVVAEFGTVNFDKIFAALRADNWIHVHDHPGSAQWIAVKQQMYDAFVLPGAEWQNAIVSQGMQVIAETAAKLAVTADI